jgi:geranylgeranyl pyrophosphate synthase
MPTVSEPLPLGEHRSRVLKYLRALSRPFTSVAAAIIEERLPPEDSRVMLRSTLVLWAARACGEDSPDALPVAASFDLFDRFMLLHDELIDRPAAGERNESPVIARWGLGQSLNAGDAIFALALRSLADDVVNAKRRLRVASLVTGAVLEAIEGRTNDVERNARGAHDGGLFSRVRSVRRRSASLTGAALESGALVAGAPDHILRGFNRAGRLLDVAGSTADGALARRVAAKAVDALERCAPDRTQLASLDEVVRYVAYRAA